MEYKTTEKKRYTSYLVRDEELLYRLADARLLDKLHGVADNKFEPGKHIYFFDMDAQVAKIFFDYKDEVKERMQNEQ